MYIGIATDHGAFSLKQELALKLSGAGHEVSDFVLMRSNPMTIFLNTSRSQ